VTISFVEKKSLAQKFGLETGDRILAFDGFEAVDILDYQFYDALENFIMTVERKNGIKREVKVKKKAHESLELEFEDDGLDVKPCKNNCVFCFVDQLPKDYPLRKSLRVKDDDYRHSFLSGTYITLSNITENDIERIIRLRLSPLYISVHSLDETIRTRLLRTKHERKPMLPILQRLSKAGIKLHTQIVYCPDFNEDIEVSARILQPLCQSLAVVPVGLTKYHNKELRPVCKDDAEKIITLIEKLQAEFLEKNDSCFIFAADEFYIKAQKQLPSPNSYESYPQIENGVGLFAKFDEDFAYALEEITETKPKIIPKYKSLSIATSVSAYDFIKQKAQILEKKFGIKILVYKIQNDFFGDTVTVVGLLTGGDIKAQLQNKHLGEVLLLPNVMFREFGEEFLDNIRREDLMRALNIYIEKVPSDGYNFVYAALGHEGEEE